MRTPDLVRAAVGGLRRQKARAALTLAGVAVGSSALAVSLSLGLGLRAMVDREFAAREAFWQVYVRVRHDGQPVPEADIPAADLAVPGEMSADRRARLRARKVRAYQAAHPRRAPVPLTRDKVADLAALPDVAEVRTAREGVGRVAVGGAGVDAYVAATALPAADLGPRLVAGRLPAGAAEAVVTEAVLYDLGLRDEAAATAALGGPVRVEVGGGGGTRAANLARALGVPPGAVGRGEEQMLDKVARQLPAAVGKLDLSAAEKAAVRWLFAAGAGREAGRPAPAAEFRLAGVARGPTAAEERAADRSPAGWLLRRDDAVYLTPAGGDRLFGQLDWVRETGFEAATLVVRPGGDLQAVADAVEEMGFAQHSAAEYHAAVKREVTLIAAGLNAFALISLVVAGLGITNTLVTTVVERTREIGVLKALGAADRQVVALFLAEGAVVGLVGGLLGLGLALALSVPGDGLVRRLVQEQSKEPMVTRTVFEFPGWLAAGTVAFAVGVTTLAAVYPARRAARIHPVEALRHG